MGNSSSESLNILHLSGSGQGISNQPGSNTEEIEKMNHIRNMQPGARPTNAPQVQNFGQRKPPVRAPSQGSLFAGQNTANITPDMVQAYWTRVEKMKADYLRHLTLMIQTVERLSKQNGPEQGLDNVLHRLYLLVCLLLSSLSSKIYLLN